MYTQEALAEFGLQNTKKQTAFGGFFQENFIVLL